MDFGATFRGNNGSLQTGVAVDVTGANNAWTADALSEIDEQVERCWVPHTAPGIGPVLLIRGYPAAVFLWGDEPARSET